MTLPCADTQYDPWHEYDFATEDTEMLPSSAKEAKAHTVPIPL